MVWTFKVEEGYPGMQQNDSMVRAHTLHAQDH